MVYRLNNAGYWKNTRRIRKPLANIPSGFSAYKPLDTKLFCNNNCINKSDSRCAVVRFGYYSYDNQVIW